MTKRFSLYLAVSLLFSFAAFAQKAAIGVFATNPGYVKSGTVSRYEGGWGLSAEYWFSPRVSGAVSVSREQYYVPMTNFQIAPGDPVTNFERKSVYPIDAIVRYRFTGDEHWKPYVGLGVRGMRFTSVTYMYTVNPGDTNYTASAYTSRARFIAPVIDGGVTFLINRSVGIDVDASRVLNQNVSEPVDQFRAAAGISWRF